LLTPIGQAAHARLTVAEAPPGPPVLAPMVVELYGPTAETRREVARNILRIMERTPHVADVNTYMEAPYEQIEFHVDRQRAKMFGVSVEDINRELAMATGGFEVGALQSTHNLEQAVIVLQVPLATRVNLGNLLVLPVRNQSGSTTPLSELGQFLPQRVDPPIYHKDLRAVEYVTGDVIGRLGAPLYGMLAVDSALKNYVTPDRKVISGHYFVPPESDSVSGFKWDGEWQVTYVTFRDMGLAFMAALVLIYILVVAEFRSFILPLVVMAPIPLTMIGIVPGHWLLGADFTATSMIGFIALAGIIVRNSILLVEFARERVSEGMSVPEAITLAGRVRLRPIMITALALVIGSMVLLTDPIFQGMAVSLLFGSLVATFLTLVVIPMGCVSARKYFTGRPPHGGAPSPPPGGGPGGGPTPPPGGGGAPPSSAPEPSGARPPRLVRRSGEAATTEPGPAAAAPGRPARLMRKGEAETAATPPPPAQGDAAAAPGRPPRLMKRAEREPQQAGEPAAPAPADAEAAAQSPQIRDSEPEINDSGGDSA
jgi:multidrug efflux pump subunit AcrB